MKPLRVLSEVRLQKKLKVLRKRSDQRSSGKFFANEASKLELNVQVKTKIFLFKIDYRLQRRESIAAVVCSLFVIKIFFSVPLAFGELTTTKIVLPSTGAVSV